MPRRRPAPAALLAAALVAFAGCDSDPFESVPADAFAVRILAPRSGARIELGETFSMLASITAGENIEEVGVQLTWSPPDGEGAPLVLYRESFIPPDVATYTIDLDVTIDELDGVDGPDDLDPAGQYTLGIYGQRPSGQSGTGILVFVQE